MERAGLYFGDIVNTDENVNITDIGKKQTNIIKKKLFSTSHLKELCLLTMAGFKIL